MSIKTKVFLGAVILFAVISINIFIYIHMLKAEPYRVSVTFLSRSNIVAEMLGKPNSFSVNFITGYGAQHTNSGEEKAQYRINIYGEKNKGMAEIELETEKRKWLITKAILILKHGEKVNLLENGQIP